MGAFDDLVPAQPGAPAANDSDFARLITGEKAAPKASPLWDVLRSVGTGLRSGVEGLAGLPGDLSYLGQLAVEKARTGLGYEPNPDWDKPPDMSDVPFGYGGVIPRAPTSQDIRGVTEKVIGKGYEPETTGGKYAKTISEFMPGAMLGPGSVARKAITMGAIPGGASEAAGQATEGTDYEPYARAGAAVAGGVGSGLLFAPRAAQTVQQAQRANVVDAAGRQSLERVAAPNPVQGMPPVDTPAPGGAALHIPEAAMPDARTGGYVAGKLGQVPIVGSPLAKSAERT